MIECAPEAFVMQGDKVSDIVSGQKDFAGANIETVYSKVSGIYAVYRTAERVMLQFADSEELGKEQRLALSPLNPIRGEINGLLDGWRGSSQFNAAEKVSRAKRFDRRTADAFTIAFQGDQAHALELLQGVKADILEERTSTGRAEYLSIATLTALAVFFLFWWLSSPPTTPNQATRLATFISGNNIWLATGMGCLGALFSIAMGIRDRDIKPDLQRRDNIVDAILRVLIGASSAVILFSLIKSGLVTLMLGTTKIDVVDSQNSANHLAIIVAFLAGFSERLVGGFLGTTVLSAIGAPSSQKDSSAVTDARSPQPAADEQNPRGNQSSMQSEADHVGHVHDDAGADGCICDVQIAANETTDDVELPEATGGIAKAA